MLSPIEIPTMLFWENGNTWYGSKGEARFFIHPASHEDGEGAAHAALDVELWKGPFSRALSQVLAEASFPLCEEGLVQLTAWLEEQAAVLNAPEARALKKTAPPPF